jgi:hypothetical protein
MRRGDFPVIASVFLMVRWKIVAAVLQRFQVAFVMTLRLEKILVSGLLFPSTKKLARVYFSRKGKSNIDTN